MTKAQVGDYIRYEANRATGRKAGVSKVTDVMDACSYAGEIYLLEDGAAITESELTLDDVLLPSEVEFG